MPNITLLENSDDDDHDDTELEDKMCKICSTVTAKYTCPRCGAPYCSVPCYQSEAHGSCSEAFYRECIVDELATVDDDPDAELKMREILRRLQENDVPPEEVDSDDEMEPDLCERLSSVDLDDADTVWEKLTPAERQEFEDLVRSGDVSKIITTWTPWWMYKKEKSLIEECGANVENYAVHCPTIKSDILPLSKISKVSPSVVVAHNLVNVVAAYCYVCRWLNGDQRSYSAEAVNAFITLSGNLASGHNYDSCQLAVEAVAHEATNCAWLGGSPDTTSAMRDDVDRIVSGPEETNPSFYLRAALSDVHALLTLAKKPGKTKNTSQFARRFGDNMNVPTTGVLSKEKLRPCVKKVEYLLAWVQDHGTELCSTWC